MERIGKRYYWQVMLIGMVGVLLTACSTTSRVPDDDQLFVGLKKITYENYVESAQATTTQEELEAALATAPNGALFGSSYYRTPFAPSLWIWNAFSTGESKFSKWMTSAFGKAPVLMSNVNPGLRASVAQSVLRKHGYFHGTVGYDIVTQSNPKKAKIAYKVEITEVRDLNGDGAVDLSDVQYLLKNDKNVLSTLKTGDFRDPECIELLKQADIVVTNPPFSLFREYIGQLVEYDKKFLIIGNMNAIHYKEVFPLIKDNKVWTGFKPFGGGMNMIQTPTDFDPSKTKSYTINEKGQIIKNIMGVIWFTNLDHNKRHEELDLVCRYSCDDYPTYDNYDAIDVGKVQDIPYDYDGIMGVPDTILGQLNPDQFEIIGLGSGDLAKQAGVKKNYRGRTDLAYTMNGKSKCPYSRILIRNKHPKTI